MDQLTERLSQQLHDRKIVAINKYSTFGRNLYSLPGIAEILVPDIVISEFSTNIDDFSLRPKMIVSREERVGKRDKTDYLSLVLDEIVRLLKSESRPPVLLSWNQTPYISKIQSMTGAISISLPKDISDFIEEKTNLDAFLQYTGVPSNQRIKTLVYPRADHLPSYETVRAIQGSPFILQGKSSGGKGTFIIQSSTDYDQARTKLIGKVRVMEFFDGFSSNTTIINVPLGESCQVYVDFPSHKATGIKETSCSRVAGAGNDWSLNFPEHLCQKFINQVVELGKYLYREYGLVGMWGVDSIWTEDSFRINEINCRLQGTSEVSAINQIQQDFPPFYLIHLAIFLGIKLDNLPVDEEFNRSTCQQMIRKQKQSPFYLKIPQINEEPMRLKDSFPGSGLYQLTPDGSLQWLKPAYSSISADWDQGQILIANAPLKDSVCYPRVKLCTAEGMTNFRSIFYNKNSLTSGADRLVKAIYHYFQYHAEKD